MSTSRDGKIGFWSVVAIGVGGMVGGGIFAVLSRGWIAGAVACLSALGALVWQTTINVPEKLWALGAKVALAVMIEGSYRLTKREFRLHE